MTATINAHAMDLGTVRTSISDRPPRTPAMIWISDTEINVA